MRDLPGIALIILGCGLLINGLMKRRARGLAIEPAGTIRPEFAAMGEIVRPLIQFALALVALKMAAFYFLFDGARLLSPLTFGGFLFVLAAYGVWLVLVMKRPIQSSTVPSPAASLSPDAVPAGATHTEPGARLAQAVGE